MSTPEAGGSGAGGEKPRGFQKFMRRASTILKRDKTKRQSIAGTSAAPPVAEQRSGPSSTPTPAPELTVKPAVPSTQPGPLAPTSESTKSEAGSESAAPKPKPSMTAAESSRILEEKARALFQKYNMTIEEGEWIPPFKGDALRIEKKVRMRIHRQCHRCHHPFGVEKVCINCSHNRCKKCPRSSISSRRDGTALISITSGSIIVDDSYKSLISIDTVAMPYRKSTKALVNPALYKRTCHKCQTVFAGNAPQCGSCGHSRCTLCPRDPPMISPMPSSAMPRRRQMRSLRLRIRYTCHECSKTYRDLEKNCSKCGHAKCDTCPSDPALNSGPVLDAEAIRAVEGRLRNLEVSPQAAAA